MSLVDRVSQKIGLTDFMVTKSQTLPDKTVSSNLLKMVVSFLCQRHLEKYVGLENSLFECGLALFKEEGVSKFCHFSLGHLVMDAPQYQFYSQGSVV